MSVQLVGGQEVHHVLHQLSLHLNTSSSCTLNLMIPFNSLSIIIVIILKIKIIMCTFNVNSTPIVNTDMYYLWYTNNNLIHEGVAHDH